MRATILVTAMAACVFGVAALLLQLQASDYQAGAHDADVIPATTPANPPPPDGVWARTVAGPHHGIESVNPRPLTADLPPAKTIRWTNPP